MSEIIIILLISGFITESITKVVVSSVIAEPIRLFIDSRSEFFGELVNCGYCFSFWISLISCLTLIYLGILPVLVNTIVINFIIVLLLIQRLSNIIHGAIDKYFEKNVRQEHLVNFNDINTPMEI